MKKQTIEYRLPLIKGLVLGLGLLGLVGCSSSASNNFWSYGDGVPRRMEADYGRSVTNNRLEMMLTPPDAVDTRPPLGMPPVAAKNTQDRYDKSFKDKEPPSPIIQIIK